MNQLALGLIGNSNISALVDASGRIVWSCFPRFDGDPIFCALLGGTKEIGGSFSVELERCNWTDQCYLRNTAILITKLYDEQGGIVEITDFAPRFRHFGRLFRPMTLVRRIRILGGSPVIRVRLEPCYEFGAHRQSVTLGSNHLRFVAEQFALRVTTDASLTAVFEQNPFILDRDLTFILGPDESITDSVSELGARWFGETRNYWQDWVRFLGIPFEWQDAVIRAAITLKLSSCEDTGAIVAAMTTSIPEAPDSGRNWDYRYCWLRDSYFVVAALNRLNATRTMEQYIRYIINIVVNLSSGTYQPVYKISGQPHLIESIISSLPGYRGMGPVRTGNDAYRQIQNDVYGSIVLAATHMFFDQRLDRPGDETLYRRLEPLGEAARQVYNKPDAGIWELRNEQRVHTFSSVMCWVACDRLARIGQHLGLVERAQYWRLHADTIHAVICSQAWNTKLDSFVESFGGKELDASLLLLHELGFLAADDPRFASTVTAVGQQLKKGDFVFRYVTADDFGRPETAFLVCTFWYVDALTAVGRKEEARELFETLLSCRNHLGLLSEDINPDTHELWGNFPQTYSMVGLINSAMRLSRGWEETF
jgi:GH15 family glucan-1,4-alpha-glucosidase